MWLDVSSPTGARLGPGPVITATGWQCKRALDRAGDFAFNVPLADPRASLLQAFRTVRAWAMLEGGTMRELGSGTVKRTEAAVSASGADMLAVNGPDSLEELARVSVGDLQVFDTIVEHPSTALWLTGIYHHEMAHYGNAAVTMTNALDGAAGDTATYVTVNIDSNAAAIELRATRAFHGIQLRFGPNVNMAAGPELFLHYWDATVRFDALHGLGDWVALGGIDDGTNRAAADAEPLHLGQDGTIWFTPPAAWVAVDGYYRLRITGDDIGFSVTGNLDIADIAIVYETPTATALSKLAAFFPAGWSFDAAHGLTETEHTVYWQAAGESLLEAFVRVAELTGEHFSGPYSGKQVIWWGTTQEVAALRAVGGPGLDGLAIADNPNVCLITHLSEILDAYSLATRVTPYGAGTGAARITLADISDPLPAGYSLDGETLVRDAAEAALGRIEKRLDCPDIEATDNSLEQRQYAANALLQQAHAWLRTHSATDTDRLTGDMPRAYTLTVTKADRVLWPNHLLHVVYVAYRDGVKVWDIDRWLTILSATTEYSSDGLRTVALEVATVQAPLDNDAIGAVQVKRDARAMRAHGANPVGTILAGPASGLDMTGLTQAFDAAYTAAGHALDTAASQHAGGVGGHTHAGPSSTGGPVAHGVTTGLGADDHTQYLLATGARTGASSQAQAFTNGIIGPSWKPAADSTTALQLQNAAGTLPILNVDSTNGVVSIGGVTGSVFNLDVLGNAGIRILAADNAGSAIFRLTTANTPGAGTGSADIQFYDGATLGFRFLAAFGNAAAARYGGFIAYTDRDGNKLPLRFFTTDAGGTVQTALYIAAGQTAGTAGNVGIGGLVTPASPLAVFRTPSNTAGTTVVGFPFVGTSGNNDLWGFRLSATTYNFNLDRNYGSWQAVPALVIERSTGSVGIGTTSPGARLTVLGAADIQQMLVTGHTTQAVATGLVAFTRNDAAAGVSRMLTLTALGSGADGDGGSVVLLGKSSTTAAQAMGRIAWLWGPSGGATHASRKANVVWYASDSGGEREIMRGAGTGTAGAICFLAATAPVGVATVNAAATDLATTTALTNQLRAALVALGLCV